MLSLVLLRVWRRLSMGISQGISLDEMLVAASAWNMHAEPDEVEALFTSLDEDQDGLVDFGEFTRGTWHHGSHARTLLAQHVAPRITRTHTARTTRTRGTTDHTHAHCPHRTSTRTRTRAPGITAHTHTQCI
jgi:hypothetical protein